MYKKNVSNNLFIAFGAIVTALVITFATISFAHAIGVWAHGSLGFNKDAYGHGECPLAMIANPATSEGIPTVRGAELCWAQTISTVQPGERVNVLAKFKNQGTSTITNARVYITDDSQGQAVTNHSFTVTLEGTANGSTVTKSHTVSFNINSAQTVTYDDTDFYRPGSTTAIPTSSTAMFNGGYPIGNVPVNQYGYMVIAFDIGHVNNGNGGNGGLGYDTFNEIVSLNPGLYEYQACAETRFETKCGDWYGPLEIEDTSTGGGGTPGGFGGTPSGFGG
jgi:hypothetical protein